jgi:hypothetical protein
VVEANTSAMRTRPKPDAVSVSYTSSVSPKAKFAS